jgi:predicted O-methyltransferase YrrM
MVSRPSVGPPARTTLSLLHPSILPVTLHPMDTRFWSRALGSFVHNLRHKDFVIEVATAGLKADAKRADGKPRAASMSLFDAYPEARDQFVPMGVVRYRKYNMDPLELYAVAVIAAVRNTKKVFEIGTFDGATTGLVARMVPDAQVYTLDLPPERVAETVLQTAHGRAGGVGSRFHDTPEAVRIDQLYGDSREFDFRPYYGQMDLVIVDGSHEADDVRADTENALKMLAPQGAVIWDDYNRPSVIEPVDAAAEHYGLSLVHIEHTGIAVYDAGKVPAGTGA